MQVCLFIKVLSREAQIIGERGAAIYFRFTKCLVLCLPDHAAIFGYNHLRRSQMIIQIPIVFPFSRMNSGSVPHGEPGLYP